MYLDVLTAEIVPLAHCPGWSVLLGPVHQEYARYLAAHAYVRSSHPLIWGDGFTDELFALVRGVWSITAPGWVAGDPEKLRADVAGLHGHYGISHHLAQHGHRLLCPVETVAAGILRDTMLSSVDVAAVYVDCSGPTRMTLASAFSDPNRRIAGARFDLVLDVDAHDSDAGQAGDNIRLSSSIQAVDVSTFVINYYSGRDKMERLAAASGEPEPAPWPEPPAYRPMWVMSDELVAALQAFEPTRKTSYYCFTGRLPVSFQKWGHENQTPKDAEAGLRKYISDQTTPTNAALGMAVLDACLGGFTPIVFAGVNNGRA